MYVPILIATTLIEYVRISNSSSLRIISIGRFEMQYSSKEVNPIRSCIAELTLVVVCFTFSYLTKERHRRTTFFFLFNFSLFLFSLSHVDIYCTHDEILHYFSFIINHVIITATRALRKISTISVENLTISSSGQ